MKYWIFLAILLFGWNAASANEKESELDCNHPNGQDQIIECSFITKKAAEVVLTVAYQRAMKYLKSIEGHTDAKWKGGPEALAKAQFAWVDYRMQHCRSFGLKFGGGKLLPMLINSCESELTAKRTEELNELAEAS